MILRRANGWVGRVDEQLRWRFAAQNSDGDQREVSLLVLGDRVVVVLPPGDVLVFDPDEAEELAEAVDGAVRGAESP